MEFKLQVEVEGEWITFDWESLNETILFGNDLSAHRKRFWTGLKDKNGKEIYAGDHFGNPSYPVIFYNGCFMLGGLPLIGYLNAEYMHQVHAVKGNIYQD